MQRRLALLMQEVLNERCNALIDATASEMRSDLDALSRQLVMPRRLPRLDRTLRCHVELVQRRLRRLFCGGIEPRTKPAVAAKLRVVARPNACNICLKRRVSTRSDTHQSFPAARTDHVTSTLICSGCTGCTASSQRAAVTTLHSIEPCSDQ